jgi:membrane-bound serine protease (ClpP class)
MVYMKKFSAAVLAAVLVLYAGSAAAEDIPADQGASSPGIPGSGEASGGTDTGEPGSSAGAWIIPIRGDIEPSLAVFVRREGRRAEAAGAPVIIFEIDTFGGRVDTALQISSFIMSLKNTRTVAWVTTGDESMGVSWSAGALIALSCADIYMAAGTSIGAAAPVTAGPGGAMEAAGEKTVSAVRSQMAALAERNGHPAGIALAMVDMDVELWEVKVDGNVRTLTLAELERLEREALPSSVERAGIISPKGKLLSLTGNEAVRYGLARGIAGDREALLLQLGVSARPEIRRPGAADGIVSLLTSGPVQGLLILLGIVMIFLEINTPGFGIPGAAAIIAFALVFGSGALLGRVGSAELILFLLGVGLLAVEIFILPGFGFVGISGIVLIGLSLVLSMQDFVIPRTNWEWDLLGRNAIVVAAGLVASVAGIAVLALLGPRIRIFDRLTLQTRITGTAGGPEPESDKAPMSIDENRPGYLSLAGKTGRAATTLRPSGKAEIDGELYSVEADGIFIEQGSPVRVVRVQGNNVIVKKL